MSKSLEVRRLIKKIDTANSEISRHKRNMRREIDCVPGWWKGNAASAFFQRYNEIDSDIYTLYRKIEELRSNTNRLMKLLEEEERERRNLANKLRG